MSHAAPNLIDCPTLQAELDEHFTMCDPTKHLALNETSYIRFLVSDVNAHGFKLQQRLSPGKGKRRTVDLTWTPRIIPDEMSDTPTKVCTSTNEAGMRSETFTIPDIGFQYDELFDLTELRDICKDNGLYIAERIQAIMNGAIRKMDIDAVEDLATCVGRFALGELNVNADNEKTVTSLNAAGDLNRRFISDITFAAKNASYCTNPFVLGWQESWKAFEDIRAGCCNTNSGVDIDELFRNNPYVFLPNSNIEDTFAVNHFIMLAAGATQFVYYNEFMGDRGINVIDTEDYKQMVLFEPETGLPFDFQWTNTCGDITISLKLAYQVVCIPTDVFDDGDRLDGVTQVNEFIISNP